jgi:hypothetical protein
VIVDEVGESCRPYPGVAQGEALSERLMRDHQSRLTDRQRSGDSRRLGGVSYLVTSGVRDACRVCEAEPVVLHRQPAPLSERFARQSMPPRPVWRGSSKIEWRAGAHTKLVALGIGHRDEVHVLTLAPVDSPGAQRLEPPHLGLDLGHAQIEVTPCLAPLRFRHPLQERRRKGSARR